MVVVYQYCRQSRPPHDARAVPRFELRQHCSAVEPSAVRDEDFNIIVLVIHLFTGMWLGRQDTLPFRLEELAHNTDYNNVHVFNMAGYRHRPIYHCAC